MVAESSSSRRDAQLQAITQALPAAISITDPQGRVLWLNPFWLKFTGVPFEEAVDRGWRASVHPDDLSGLVAAFRAGRDAAGPYQAEMRCRSANGDWVWMATRGEPLRGPTGRIGGWIAVSTNIDDRKRAEEALALREARFEALVRATATVVFELDAAGDHKAPNPAWSAYTGLAFEDQKDGGWASAVHLDDATRALSEWAAARAEKRPALADVRHWHAPSQAYRWVRIHSVPLIGADGDVREWIGTLTDIHDQKSATETQRTLVLELQHRVQNGLAVVRALTDQTRRGSTTLEGFIEQFEGRLEALAEAQALLTRSAAYAADLGDIARGVLQAFADAGAVTIAGPPLAVASTTAANLALALHELATNAAKYGALSRRGGHARLTWEVADGAVVLRWVETGGPKVRAPTRKGFGSRLLGGALHHEPGGSTRLDFAPGGLVCEMRWRLTP